jgi:hypothetical protein
MAYSDFKLHQLVKKFNLTLQETSDLFAATQSVEPSDYLTTTLKQNVNLAVAINTEKARSELIIAPVLLEIKRHFPHQISLFSGIDFTVDSTQGLGGTCDFLISFSPEQLYVRAPVLTLVEAKNENLKSGLAQCIAEMLGAQLFNQREENAIETVYGAVTIGTLWRFLKLSGPPSSPVVELDLTEYFIKDVAKILGILCNMVNLSVQDKNQIFR